MRRRLSFVTLAVIGFISPAVAAWADQTYRMTGTDSFVVGSRDVGSQVDYSGLQTLVLVRRGSTTKYVARATYTRSDGNGKSAAQASFVSSLSPAGEQRDEENRDPDYLTVLNQPFSVKLDAATLAELAQLRSRQAFDFASPMTGEPLHGYLSRADDAIVGGRHVLGVTFDARGPMRGRLPGRPEASLAGSIHMTGRAYYRRSDALLAALEATLTIGGTLDRGGRTEPVSIVYRRSIRSDELPAGQQALRPARF
jgi:hypothetical protein